MGSCPQAQAGLTGYQTVPARLCSSSGGPIGLRVSTNMASTAHARANHIFGPLTPCTLPSRLRQHPAPRGCPPAPPLWQKPPAWFLHGEFNSRYARQGTTEKLSKDRGINDITQSVVLAYLINKYQPCTFTQKNFSSNSSLCLYFNSPCKQEMV